MGVTAVVCAMNRSHDILLNAFSLQVIVAAEGQSMTGHRMAAALAAHPNIAVTLVPDTAVYALMSRVHKVGYCDCRSGPFMHSFIHPPSSRRRGLH